jgi:hypothetical protein
MITNVEAVCPSCQKGDHECWGRWNPTSHDDRVFVCVCSHATPLPWVYDDGGRKEAGYKGTTGDCVVRSIAIATGLAYQDVYDYANKLGQQERITKRQRTKSSARTGVRKNACRRWLADLGWSWFPTMGIGSGTTVHLRDGELPMGRLVVAVSKHYTAVIDGVIHDTHDPSRDGTRAVYGYYYLEDSK